jgi:hypothetical protein
MGPSDQQESVVERLSLRERSSSRSVRDDGFHVQEKCEYGPVLVPVDDDSTCGGDFLYLDGLSHEILLIAVMVKIKR